MPAMEDYARFVVGELGCFDEFERETATEPLPSLPVTLDRSMS